MSQQATIVKLLEESKAFQLLIDNIKEVFEQPIWKKYLTDKFTLSLDWRAILGVMENSPAASVIDFSSGKPLAVRPTASKLSGELATMGNKYQMSKREIRELMELQDNIGKFGINANDLVNFLFPDLQRATLGPHKQVDRLFLEAISTGKMSLTNIVNPKGVKWDTDLDWGIAQAKTIGDVWATSATATPLTDIRTIVDEWEEKGVSFKIMKMSRPTYNLMVNTTEFKDAFSLELGSGSKKITALKNQFLSVDSVNALMESIDLPMIEIMKDVVYIEGKDGESTGIRPFADNRVSFSADNNYGEMLRTYSNEERNPNKIKSYAKAENVLISKYMDNDGNEVTESEFNAFPVINKLKHIAILKTDEKAA